MSERSLPTLTAERRAAIAEVVGQQGSARVADLAEQFDVSATTIRRDLERLEDQRILQRVHGGAIAIEEAASERFEPVSQAPEMVRIGQAAVEMISDGETLFLGPGPISLEVARGLTARSRMTVITNGLKVAHWLSVNTSHNLIVTGGQAEGRDLALVGKPTQEALSGLRADRVILELGGVSAVEGLTHDNLSQAEIARMLLGKGWELIVLVPAERVGRVAAAHIGPVTAADVIVTAREAPSPFLWDLSEAGVRIVLA